MEGKEEKGQGRTVSAEGLARTAVGITGWGFKWNHEKALHLPPWKERCEAVQVLMQRGRGQVAPWEAGVALLGKRS